MEIQAHHRRAIDRLVDVYRDDPSFSALIIGGSVAKGCARPDSDVDFLIVATDEEFNQRREKADALFQSVKEFRGRGVSEIESYTCFMTEVEWAWMYGTTPMEDW